LEVVNSSVDLRDVCQYGGASFPDDASRPFSSAKTTSSPNNCASFPNGLSSAEERHFDPR